MLQHCIIYNKLSSANLVSFFAAAHVASLKLHFGTTVFVGSKVTAVLYTAVKYRCCVNRPAVNLSSNPTIARACMSVCNKNYRRKKTQTETQSFITENNNIIFRISAES